LASLTANTGMIFCQIELNENKSKYCSKNKERKKERKKIIGMIEKSFRDAGRLCISARCKCFANLFFATNMSSN
jgi:hypothetical protein